MMSCVGRPDARPTEDVMPAMSATSPHDARTFCLHGYRNVDWFFVSYFCPVSAKLFQPILSATSFAYLHASGSGEMMLTLDFSAAMATACGTSITFKIFSNCGPF